MAAQKASRQLLIFVPEGQRESASIPVDLQDRWVSRLMTECTHLFGGATAYGRGVGAWREGDAPDAPIHWDRVTVVECWIDPELRDWKRRLGVVAATLGEMGRELNQKAVACILNGRWKTYESSGHA
jgi:hypothetical protein